MEERICQSCAMPMPTDDLLGANIDGTLNQEYCKYCYKDGKFIDDVTMEEYIEMCSNFAEQAGMTKDEMKEYCTKMFPTLKRWKKD